MSCFALAPAEPCGQSITSIDRCMNVAPHTNSFARLAAPPRADPHPGFTCDNSFAGLKAGDNPGRAGSLLIPTRPIPRCVCRTDRGV